MTIKELIEKLKTFPTDSEIVIESIDPTDYRYVVPIENIRFEEAFCYYFLLCCECTFFILLPKIYFLFKNENSFL